MNRVALSAISFASPNCSAYENGQLDQFRCNIRISFRALHCDVSTYGFEHARSALRMPSLDVAAELLTVIKDAVVIVLIMEWSRNRVSKHALRQGGQRVDGVILEEGRSMRGRALRGGMLSWSAELVEFILGCELLVDSS